MDKIAAWQQDASVPVHHRAAKDRTGVRGRGVKEPPDRAVPDRAVPDRASEAAREGPEPRKRWSEYWALIWP